MCNVLLLHQLSGSIHNSWETCQPSKPHPGIQNPTKTTVDRVFIEHDFYMCGMSMHIFILKVYLLLHFHYLLYFTYSSVINIALAFKFLVASDVLRIMKY